MEAEAHRKLKEEADLRHRQFERELLAIKRQQEEAEKKMKFFNVEKPIKNVSPQWSKQHSQSDAEFRPDFFLNFNLNCIQFVMNAGVRFQS
jgi:hypothetical protein